MNTGRLIKVDGEDGISAAGMLLVKRTAETLHKHYPGHLWAVNINEEGGIMTVMNLALSGKWGFMLKLRTVQEDPDLKSAENCLSGIGCVAGATSPALSVT